MEQRSWWRPRPCCLCSKRSIWTFSSEEPIGLFRVGPFHQRSNVHGEHLLDMLIALDQGSSEQLTGTKAVNPPHYSHGEVLEALMTGEAVAAGGVKYISYCCHLHAGDVQKQGMLCCTGKTKIQPVPDLLREMVIPPHEDPYGRRRCARNGCCKIDRNLGDTSQSKPLLDVTSHRLIERSWKDQPVNILSIPKFYDSVQTSVPAWSGYSMARATDDLLVHQSAKRKESMCSTGNRHEHSIQVNPATKTKQ